MTTGEARFIELYEQHYRQIRAYCGRRTGSDRVEDAVADTFMTAWRRIDDVPTGESALPWLYGVAYKVLAHQWRSASRRRRLEEKLSSVGIEPVVPPEEVVVERQEARQVQAALKRVNRTDGEILRLAAWEQLSHTEIAAVLGITVEATRQRFYQAKKNATREYNRLEKKRAKSPAVQEGGVW